MILLLDTDVLLDVVLDRRPHSDAASRLLDNLQRRPGTGFMAWHTISNFFYLVRPLRGGLSARLLLLDLARFIRVAPTTTESLLYAAQLEMPDFEDALQVAAASACQADGIVTRNLRDYAKASIRALGPEAANDELETR